MYHKFQCCGKQSVNYKSKPADADEKLPLVQVCLSHLQLKMLLKPQNNSLKIYPVHYRPKKMTTAILTSGERSSLVETKTCSTI